MQFIDRRSLSMTSLHYGASPWDNAPQLYKNTSQEQLTMIASDSSRHLRRWQLASTRRPTHTIPSSMPWNSFIQSGSASTRVWKIISDILKQLKIWSYYQKMGPSRNLSRLVSTEQKTDTTVTDEMVVQKILTVAFIEQVDSTRYYGESSRTTLRWNRILIQSPS